MVELDHSTTSRLEVTRVHAAGVATEVLRLEVAASRGTGGLLVDGESEGTTALVTISGASHVAGRGRQGVTATVDELVAAVALARVLQAGICEALGVTCGNASRNGHVLAGVCVCVKRALGGVGDTAIGDPALGQRDARVRRRVDGNEDLGTTGAGTRAA